MKQTDKRARSVATTRAMNRAEFLRLAARVAGLKVTLVEIDAALCRLAADNARLNRLDDRVDVLTLDVESAADLLAAALSGGER